MKLSDLHPDEIAPVQQVAAQPSSLKLSDLKHSDIEFVGENEQQAKYGGAGQQALAGLEGIARGATFGGSDWAETKLGLADAKDIKQREEANPWTSGIGNVVGGAGILAATGGLAAPAATEALIARGLAPEAAALAAKHGLSSAAEAALVAGGKSPLAARALAWGAEGALFGAGNVNSDLALGDPNLNATKIVADLGFGALAGAGLGILSKGIGAVPSLFKRSAVDAAESAEGVPIGTPDSPTISSDIPTAPQAAEGSFGIKNASVDELNQKIKDASFSRQTTSSGEKESLEGMASRVQLENPIHPLQTEALTDGASKDLYKTAKELSGKTGDAIRGYEALQKNELVSKLDSTINELHPTGEPVADAVKNGERAIEIFKNNYEAEKNLLKPAFEELKNIETPDPFNHVPGVIEKFTDAVPGVARMFDNSSGELKIKKYRSSWGIDKATYTAVKDSIEALQEEPAFVKELLNIRKGLDQNINILEKGAAASEIGALKKSLMDYVQEQVEKHAGDSQADSVREVFKRYAINEQQRSVVEKAFGASVGSPEFGAISKVKPENIVDNIFKNTATVDAAKNILPESEFNELLANHLAEQRAKVTDVDKNLFSSNKFRSYLNNNKDALGRALQNSPEKLQRINDLTGIMRILPDAPSINPSGTAKTIWGIFKAHSLTDLLSNAKEFGAEKLQQHQMSEKINEALGAKSEKSQQLSTLKKMADKVTENIESGVKSIFGAGAAGAALRSGGAIYSDKKYDERVKRLKELSDPTAMMNHLGNDSEHLYAAAPNITQSIHNTMIAGTQFLNSKIPQAQNQLVLSGKWGPSPDQVSKFNRYYDAVDNPIASLSAVKKGTLHGDTMEALQAVHPQLLEEMQKSIVEHMDPEKAMKLPYPVKISLAKFMGQPLDNHMLPESIMSYQNSLMAPDLSKQTSGRKSGGMKQLDVSQLAATRTQRVDES